MADSLKSKILSGVFWQGLERIGSQGFVFLISIVLARLLAPAEFGIVAILTVFISLCSVFVDSGFGVALIQKKEMTEADCCSVFYINVVMALIMYAILFAAAPWIAAFYHTPDLSRYLRVMAVMVVIRSFGNVQSALLGKRMLFHLSCRINWTALLFSGITGIIMAARGFGVWALITQQLTNAFVVVAALWFWVKWRPQWLFDLHRAKSLFQFSWKLFVSGFLDALYNDVYSLVIGKIADMKTLSYYNHGKTIPFSGMSVINATLGSVLFPAFSELQSDRKKMRELTKRGLHNIMFAVIPAMTLLFIFAEPLVRVLLTEKWLPCVPFLRLCCLTYVTWPLSTTNLQIITACGRSDVFLILEIIKKIQCVIIIFATYRYGVVTMVAVSTAMGIVVILENGWVNRKLIGYAPWTQLWDLLPLFLISAFAGAFLFYGSRLVANPWLQLLGGGTLFAMSYLAGCRILHLIPQDFINLVCRRFFQKKSDFNGLAG